MWYNMSVCYFVVYQLAAGKSEVAACKELKWNECWKQYKETIASHCWLLFVVYFGSFVLNQSNLLQLISYLISLPSQLIQVPLSFLRCPVSHTTHYAPASHSHLSLCCIPTFQVLLYTSLLSFQKMYQTPSWQFPTALQLYIPSHLVTIAYHQEPASPPPSTLCKINPCLCLTFLSFFEAIFWAFLLLLDRKTYSRAPRVRLQPRPLNFSCNAHGTH